jgi:hypothetical protein
MFPALRPFSSGCLTAAVASLCLLTSPAAMAAPEIHVAPVDCKSGVHLVAREARLSEVLAKLSEKLSFKLRYKAQTDETVSIDITLPPVKLVQKLTASVSVVINDLPDKRCPGERSLDKVWVLPTTSQENVRLPEPAVVETASEVDLDDVGPTDDPAMNELYRKVHGLPPRREGPKTKDK